MDYLTLAFDRPAEAWNEALPLGNGSMGAMSYGGLREEKIELNLDTLWSGTGRSKENKNTDVDWDFLRQKIFDGKYEDPVVTDDPELTRLHILVDELLGEMDARLKTHDFRMVPGG